jgi:hypothetical protein
MSKQRRCIAKFGDPTKDRATFEKRHMVLYDIPDDINKIIPVLPNRIYCNKVIVEPLTNVLNDLVISGLYKEIKTYDGCFNIRKSRGTNVISMHSFGIAIDMNAAWNPLLRGVHPNKRSELRKEYVKWSEKFLDVWRRNGWDCGADWNTVLDGMHFEIKL